MLGDPLNLAARLEGAGKHYKLYTLIGENTYNKVKDEIICRLIDRVLVVGKHIPIRIYEPIANKSKITKEQQNMIEKFENARQLYLDRKWIDAVDAFREINDGPSNVYLDRIMDFISKPPGDEWNGVYELTQK